MDCFENERKSVNFREFTLIRVKNPWKPNKNEKKTEQYKKEKNQVYLK
jgi:hypothetical protein